MSEKKGKEKKFREATVVFADRKFTVHALNIRASREWRKMFGKHLRLILGMLKNADSLELVNNDGDLNAGTIVGLVRELGILALDSIDLFAESLFDYSPALAAERDWIEENAEDSELLEALFEIIKLAYPFGFVARFLTNGQDIVGTLKS